MTAPSTPPASDVAPTQATLIHLAGHEYPFALQQHYCDNPACHCDEAVLTLTEACTGAEPLSVGLRLNLITWQENKPPPRSTAAHQLVQSFLETLSPALKAEFQDNYQHTKAVAHRLANYRLEPEQVVAGTLVSYLDVVTEHGGVSSGGSHYTYRLPLQDQEYLIEDLYCPSPACHCKEVHVLFMGQRVDPAQARVHIENQLLARVPLRGRAKIEDIMNGTAQQAKALLAAWQRHYPQAQALFKARYEDIKAVGERSLASHRPAGRSAKGRGKIGRNDPCSCGSGKKYKKCCG